jgi:phosphinothricin acetyltransferase
MIRSANRGDAAAICAIYNHYVLETWITFEETPVSVEEMEERIAETTASLPWMVWEREDGSVLGYSYASRWKGRCAYRFSTESTVYVAPAATGQRIGSQLYEALLGELRAIKIHTAIGGIALPNEASVALHERMGFAKIAHFREVGWKFERWIDVGYWQLVL